ncbi:MAG TPA: hypothetical protein VH186_02530 [Chloroflexia bacterium]|nr:hypothetical protein [Chloroflexia bacterium]
MVQKTGLSQLQGGIRPLNQPKHPEEVRAMGKRNDLIEGVSGMVKTSVLRRCGYAAINGERELRYQGTPRLPRKPQAWARAANIFIP